MHLKPNVSRSTLMESILQGVNAEFENEPNKDEVQDEVQYEAKFEAKGEVKDRGEQAVKKEELMSHAQNQEAHDPFSLVELVSATPLIADA